MNSPRLPSPFYHFEYNDSGYITKTGYSSGLVNMDLEYSNQRLARMVNTNDHPHGDIFQYAYFHGDVVTIDITDRQGINYRRAHLIYSAAHQLLRIDWEMKLVDAFDFSPDITFELSYHPDGNLKQLITHYHAVGSQTEATLIDKFEDYDDKINVDAFSLFHPDLDSGKHFHSQTTYSYYN